MLNELSKILARFWANALETQYISALLEDLDALFGPPAKLMLL